MAKSKITVKINNKDRDFWIDWDLWEAEQEYLKKLEADHFKNFRLGIIPDAKRLNKEKDASSI